MSKQIKAPDDIYTGSASVYDIVSNKLKHEEDIKAFEKQFNTVTKLLGGYANHDILSAV